MKYAIVMLIAILISSVAESSPQKSSFDSYVSGALDVYSQFKTPSKEESEKFYTFLNAKWTITKCTTECKQFGYTAAKEYVNQRNIQIDNDKPKKEKK